MLVFGEYDLCLLSEVDADAMAENGFAVESLSDLEGGVDGVEGADDAAERAQRAEGVERVGGVEGAADGCQVGSSEDEWVVEVLVGIISCGRVKTVGQDVRL